MYEIPKIEVVDIDDQDDWYLAEAPRIFEVFKEAVDSLGNPQNPRSNSFRLSIDLERMVIVPS